MKSRLLTTLTWLALVQVLVVLVNHHGCASATVNLTESNGSTPYVVSEPEIPYEELEEPRVLPLQAALPVSVKEPTPIPSIVTDADSRSKRKFQALGNQAPDQAHSDINTVLKVILEEPEINDEPFTTTHGYPTFSADDNFGNLLLVDFIYSYIRS